jgi:hypothetical protein
LRDLPADVLQRIGDFLFREDPAAAYESARLACGLQYAFRDTTAFFPLDLLALRAVIQRLGFYNRFNGKQCWVFKAICDARVVPLRSWAELPQIAGRRAPSFVCTVVEQGDGEWEVQMDCPSTWSHERVICTMLESLAHTCNTHPVAHGCFVRRCMYEGARLVPVRESDRAQSLRMRR